ncbi:hypothetical protein B0H11DRAFT_1934955 [Mycena galericulata]|nr:hypothetical protein B0H11DRAFT_1934955 [Mycena galericulata]
MVQQAQRERTAGGEWERRGSGRERRGSRRERWEQRAGAAVTAGGSSGHRGEQRDSGWEQRASGIGAWAADGGAGVAGQLVGVSGGSGGTRGGGVGTASRNVGTASRNVGTAGGNVEEAGGGDTGTEAACNGCEEDGPRNRAESYEAQFEDQARGSGARRKAPNGRCTAKRGRSANAERSKCQVAEPCIHNTNKQMIPAPHPNDEREVHSTPAKPFQALGWQCFYKKSPVSTGRRSSYGRGVVEGDQSRDDGDVPSSEQIANGNWQTPFYRRTEELEAVGRLRRFNRHPKLANSVLPKSWKLWEGSEGSIDTPKLANSVLPKSWKLWGLGGSEGS